MRCIEVLSIVPEHRRELELALVKRRPFTKPKLQAGYRERAIAPTFYVDGVITPWRLEDLRRDLLPFTQPDAERRPLVMHVDSPGGMVAGVPETCEVLRRVARVRPVIVLAQGYLCSAAYWLTSPATKIVASPTCSIGSCGVISTLIDDSEALAKEGVRFVVVATSPAKLFAQPGVPVDDAMQEQARIRNSQVLYLFAKDLIASPRLDEKQLKRAFEADVFLAEAARGHGMIDEVGLIEDAVEAVEAKIEPFADLRGRAASAKFDHLVADAAGVAAYGAPKTVVDQVRAKHPILAAAADAHAQRR